MIGDPKPKKYPPGFQPDNEVDTIPLPKGFVPDEPSKKKGIGSLGVGAMSAESGLSSTLKKDTRKADTEGLMKGIRYTEVEPEVKVEKPESTIDDPVGDIINPLEEKFNKSLKDYKQFGGEGRMVGESTAQKPLVSKLPTQKTIKEISKAELEKSSGEFEEGLKAVEENLFPSGIAAGDYVKKMVQEHGIDEIKNNKTVQLAFDKFQRYERLKEMVKAEPNILQLAVDIERMNDKNFDKQVLQLEGGDENDRGLDNYMNVLPQSVTGAILDRLIHNRDIKTLAREDENVKRQLDELKDGGIYKALPEYGEIVARNILSREYQKRRANRIANPIFDKSKYLDNLSDEVFADNPALKEIADTMKGNWEGKIDTGGLVDEFGTGARKTFQQMGESFKDFIGAGKTEKERITEGLKQEYENVSSGVSGGWKKLGQAANFGGMLMAMAATGVPARALMSPKAAHIAITGTTFFDEEKNRATMKFPGEPGKANLEALGMTTLYTIGLRNGLPAKQLTDVISKSRPEISQTIKNLSADAVESEIKNGMSNALQKAVKGTFTGAGEMVALTTINQTLDKALGLNGETFSRYHPDNELLEVAESMIIGLAAPQLISNIGNRKAVSNSLYNMAEYPQRYKDILSGQPLTADIQKRIENIDFLYTQKKLLDERGVTEPNQKIFLLEAMNEKFINEKLEGGKKEPKGALIREAKEELKDHQEIQERILSGEDAENIVTERQQEKLDEVNEAKIKLERLKVDNDLANEKLDAQRKDLDGRNPEDRLKIKEIEEKRKRENEDYQREAEEHQKIIDENEPKEEEERKTTAVIMPEENKVAEVIPLKKVETEQTPNIKQEGGQDAIQEQIPNEMDVRQQAEHGERMGEGNIQPEIPTRKEEGKGTGEGKEPPISEPIFGKGESDIGGITHAANEVRRMDRKLPEYQKSPETFEQWNTDAEQKIKEGYDVDGLINRIEKGHDPTPVENSIRKIYIATLDAEIVKNPTDELLAKQKRFIEVGDLANSRAGKNLVSLKGENSPLSSISDFYVAKMEAAGTDKLTDQQKKETKEAFDAVQKADADAEAKLKIFEEENAKLKAENELLKQVKEIGKKKQSAGKGVKKTREDFVKERQSLKEELQAARKEHEDWLKEQGIQKAGFGSFTIKEAKVVAKIVKSYVEEGVVKLNEVVDKVFDEVRGVFPNISKRDIHDVIAGEYAEKRPTRSELAATMRDLKDESYYINKLERLLAGTEPKGEKKKQERNREITELKQKIDGFKKEESEFEKFHGESYAAEARIEKLQDELERVQFRREKEKPQKGTKEEKEMSDREKELRSQIEQEQAKWDAEMDAAKIAKKEYRKLETERNRQIEKVSELKKKLSEISGGNLPQRQKREVKQDTPEIDALKEEIKTAEKFIRSAKATQERIRKMEGELQRLKERRDKEPTDVKRREPTVRENELKTEIIAERKSFEKEKREAGQFYREDIDPDVRKLEAIKKSNEKREKEIRDKISKGDFETKKKVPFLENAELQKKFPQKYKAALDAIVKKEEARHEFDIAILKDQMEKRSLGKKGIDLAGDVIGTTKAVVTGIDASGIAIQNLVAMVAHPRSASKALPASFTDFVSAKNQERWLAGVHSSKDFPLSQKAGLDITEPKSLKSSEKEEIFTHNLLDKRIKVKGKTYVISKYLTKPFERIFTGLGNRMRWNLWTRGVEKLYNEGYTWESHPEEFKSLAKVLNTETGRGTLHPQIDKAFNLVSAGIWSPRLMASRMNILGLGDLGNLIAGGKKGYYGGLTPKMRAYALKDLAKFIVFGTSFMGLAGLTFADDVDLNPNSSTFGSFLVNGKRYNIWGGFTQYVKLIAKYIRGGETTGSGEFRESNVLQTTGRFLWSKTTPAVGTAIGWFNKDTRTDIPKDYMGKPMTLEGTIKSLIVPLSIRGIAEGVKKEGAGSILWTGVPSFIGLNVSYESDFKKDSTQTKDTKQTKQSGRKTGKNN